jgi:undecaprenyl-diphosphatase
MTPAPAAEGRAALVVAALATAAFALFSWGVLGAGWLAQADRAVAGFAAAHCADEACVQAMRALSWLHAPRGIWAFGAATALWLAWRRAPVPGLVHALTVVVGGSVNHLLKHALARPRPGMEAAMWAATDFSFPSGHVVQALLLWGSFAAMAMLPPGRPPTPHRHAVLAFAAVALLAAAVAASRIVLRAHHFSDVLASLPVALVFLALGRLAAQWIPTERSRRGR